jgi:hypothetical protein
MPISTIDQSGLAAPLALTSPTMTGAVVSNMASSVITSGTAVASTSGTSIDFTSIPSWVKRITVMFNSVSLSGTAMIRVQLGVSGTPETTGYLSSSGALAATNTVVFQSSTAGIDMYGADVLYRINGSLIFTTMGSNLWTFMGNTTNTPATSTGFVQTTAGSKTLAGTLNMIRITTSNGTDTFDNGSINILYE